MSLLRVLEEHGFHLLCSVSKQEAISYVTLRSDLLISAMVITPAALELVLLWPFSLGGDDDRP